MKKLNEIPILKLENTSLQERVRALEELIKRAEWQVDTLYADNAELKRQLKIQTRFAESQRLLKDQFIEKWIAVKFELAEAQKQPLGVPEGMRVKRVINCEEEGWIAGLEPIKVVK